MCRRSFRPDTLLCIAHTQINIYRAKIRAQAIVKMANSGAVKQNIRKSKNCDEKNGEKNNQKRERDRSSQATAKVAIKRA